MLQQLITDNIDLWTSAKTKRSTTGRGSNKKIELTGIKKLRELILELAVRGLLVPQDPNDEPASVLLERIAAEKADLIKAGKIKKPKVLPEISSDEKPFDLPSGWEWARFPNISYYKTGKTPSTKNSIFWSVSETDTPWVSIADMTHFGHVTNTNKKITQEAHEQVFKYDPIPAGSLLMSFKLTVGKISILDIDAFHNEAIISIQPFDGVSKEYLFNFLPNRALAGNTKSAIKGNTLNSESLALITIPIPPIAEQHRIVSKVDELMALCDQLEQQQTQHSNTHHTIVTTLLDSLSQAADNTNFQAIWSQLLTNFDTLFTTEASIDQLKQTILQLAIMGKLVPQDLNDEPASVLLEKIVVEKSRQLKDGKVKKQKALREITDDEKQFGLPKTWQWIRFGHILYDIKYGTSKKSDYKVDGKPVLRIPNIVKGYIESSDLKFTQLDNKEYENLKLLEGDLLLIRSNGSTNIVGSVAMVDNKHIGFAYAGYLVRLRSNQSYFVPQYITLMMKSRFVREQIELPIRTTSGVKNINTTEISSLLFSIPPTPEQHRIVTKVDELMALCDQLKEHLNQAQTTQQHLSYAIVEQAVA